MIHTDGTPTIANYPRKPKVKAPEAPQQYAHPNALLERRDAGVYVALAYLPATRILGINVEVGGEIAWATIEPDKALDAFEHPTLYLTDTQVSNLFGRKPEAEGVVVDLSEADPDGPFDQEVEF